jgi:hypothetical protein
MLTNLINGMLRNTTRQVQQSFAQPALVPIQASTQQQPHKQFNPFMAAMNSDSKEYQDMYGVNRPLAKPMFLGYRENQALYGGSRLFILY